MARQDMDVCLRVLNESNKSRFDSYSVRNSPGGGKSANERGGDARRLAWGCKFRILVSLRVVREKI